MAVSQGKGSRHQRSNVGPCRRAGRSFLEHSCSTSSAYPPHLRHASALSACLSYKPSRLAAMLRCMACSALCAMPCLHWLLRGHAYLVP